MMTVEPLPTDDVRWRRGVTLLELLIASILGVVLILAVGHLDVARISQTNEARGIVTAQAEADFGIAHMVKQLEAADRINLLSGSSLQLRQFRPPTSSPPTSADFDNPANYVWKQYRYDSGTKEVRFYDPASSCALAASFKDVSALTITQTSNNILELVTASTNAITGTTMTYTGQVTIRGGGSDIATGLAPPGVSDPPAGC